MTDVAKHTHNSDFDILMIQIRLDKIHHKGSFQIALYFEHNASLQSQLQKIGARWSKTHNCWYMPYTSEHYKLLKQLNCELLLPAATSQSDTQVAGSEVREIPPIIAEHSDAPPPPVPYWMQDKAVHKSQNIEVESFSDLVLLPDVGRYWAFNLGYRKSIADALKKIKGVYWNRSYKCYMAFQNHQVSNQVHKVLGLNDFLPPPAPKESFNQLKGLPYYLKPCAQNQAYADVYLPKSAQVIEHVKRISYSKYFRPSDSYWVPAVPKVIEALKEMLGSMGLECVDTLPKGYIMSKNMPRKKSMELTKSRSQLMEEVPEKAKQILEDYINRILARNYSPSTLNTYGHAFIRFMRDHDYDDPGQLTERDITAYLAKLMEQGLKSASGHTLINALNFYYVEVLKYPKWQIDLPRPKKEKSLPEVLTPEECMSVFATVENSKHKLMLLLAYGSGLRVSEVIELTWGDLHLKEHKIHIKQAKGKKDRIVMLPYSVVEILQSYQALQNRIGARDYVFQGQIAGQPYHARSLQEVMRKAVAKAGLHKKATVHTLRHSFATHLLENGTDIRYIQGFLGHSSIKTTTIYAHLTKTKVEKISSPLDQIAQKNTFTAENNKPLNNKDNKKDASEKKK